jgi:rRNA small subunit pseudouridine methyltransferase Nep1
MPAGGIEIADVEQELAQAEAEKHAVYFVLEGATLEVAKIGKGYDILNSDDHFSFLKRHNKDPATYRPDIAHQVRVWSLFETSFFPCFVPIQSFAGL